MRNLELQNYGATAMTSQEMRTTNGGILGFIAGFFIGMFIASLIWAE
tara:strand:- start:431 stop:571 length:141 start_codon:yes stop_codon:yes gene_type:complete